MKEFLLANWYYLVLAFVAVAGFISSLCISLKKNKNSNIFDTIKATLLEQIPLWAIMSEGLSSGTDKKNNVISLGIALASKLLGRNLTADENTFIASFISSQLENVLSAPQKKLAMTSKSGKYTVK